MKDTLVSNSDLAQKISTIANDLKNRIKAENFDFRDKTQGKSLVYKGTAMQMLVDAYTFAIEKVNKEAVLQYGYSEAEFMQMRFTDLLAQFEDVHPGMDLDIFYPDDKFVNSNILQQSRKNGTLIYVECISQLKIVNGKPKIHYKFTKIP